MRHKKSEKKLGRSTAHLKRTMASLVSALIEQRRITTTLPKAKQAARKAEKMVTIARKGGLAAQRWLVAELMNPKAAKVLIEDVTPKLEGRAGGYTRIVKLGRRKSDSSEMAVLEWVSNAPTALAEQSAESSPAED